MRVMIWVAPWAGWLGRTFSKGKTRFVGSSRWSGPDAGRVLAGAGEGFIVVEDRLRGQRHLVFPGIVSEIRLCVGERYIVLRAVSEFPNLR